MAELRLTPTARSGLRRTLEYVAHNFGEAVAEDVLDLLVAAFDRISLDPGVGHRRTDLTTEQTIRFWTVDPTLIAYRVASDSIVEVLAVERGERDWRELLADLD